MKRLLILLAVLAAGGSPALAVSFYFVPDVPTDLGGTTYFPWNVVRNDSGAYSLALTLPFGTHLDALFRMNGGDWLFSVKSPTILGGVSCDPRDVIRFDGTTYSIFFGGASAGVPPGANVDAAFLVGGDSGTLVLGFDVPTTIGGTTYDPADLVRYSGGAFSLFFDASAVTPTIAVQSNATGAVLSDGRTILSFDIPTTLGGVTYFPGQLVAWTVAGFSLLYGDPAWRVSSRINALAFLPDPGEVPLLTVSPISPAQVRLNWTASCSAGGEDYGIYQGTIGSWYSHTLVVCHDGGTPLQEDVASGEGNRYYLVVPHSADAEGSYGRSSTGLERPPGTTACVSPQVVTVCP